MEIPNEVCEAYGVAGRPFTPVPSLINRTFIVNGADAKLVIQRLHTTFAAEVNFDLEAVTQQLAQAGFDTPLLIRTRSGDAWLTDGEGRVWRALSFVEGRVIHAIERPAQAQSAGALLGRFHRTMAGLSYQFRHVRPGAHDTAQHLQRLAKVEAEAAQRGDAEVRGVAAAILKASENVRIDFSQLPKRITHGDLKISNLLFWPDRPDQARCLIDLDTLGQQHMAYELGDALRSWCNPQGENQAQPQVDIAIFRNALEGYASTAGGLLSTEEVTSVVEGFETICLELSSRFAVDALQDRYFGWDEQRFASRREHNLVRATGQLALFGDVHSRRADLLRIAQHSF